MAADGVGERAACDMYKKTLGLQAGALSNSHRAHADSPNPTHLPGMIAARAILFIVHDCQCCLSQMR
eukprot:2685200-Pleurochrysis_carterae.AAC.1